MCETDLRDIKREDYERFGHPVFLLPCEKVLLGDGVPNRISEGGGRWGLRGVYLTQRLPLVYSPLPKGSNQDSQRNRIQSQSHLIILSQKDYFIITVRIYASFCPFASWKTNIRCLGATAILLAIDSLVIWNKFCYSHKALSVNFKNRQNV